MAINELPDTLSEPKSTLAREIEYRVTNGLGYNTTTNFYSQFHSCPEIKNSQRGLQAHLAHLEMNSAVPIIRGIYWLLENAPADYEFPIYQRRLFGILGGKFVKKQLDQKQRAKQMKSFKSLSRSYERTFNFYKEQAEYTSTSERAFKHFFGNKPIDLINALISIERAIKSEN